mgnify:CR=1 FL=1
MKNLIIALFAVIAFTGVSFSQNGGGQPLTVKAKILAQNAGCLDGYNGPLNYQVNVISACFAGGFVTEVLVLPVCTGPNCAGVRLAPLARVTFNCSEDPSSAVVMCL